MNPYTLNDFKCDVDEFNIIAGKLPEYVLVADIAKQVDLVHEEAKELLCDTKLHNYEGVLDGLCDVLYTAAYLMTLMSNAGYDVEGAMQETARNNLSKFIPNTPEGNIRLKQTLEYYGGLNVAVFAELHGPSQQWVVKNSVGKVMKPIDFVSNDLRKFIPPAHLYDA